MSYIQKGSIATQSRQSLAELAAFAVTHLHRQRPWIYNGLVTAQLRFAAAFLTYKGRDSGSVESGEAALYTAISLFCRRERLLKLYIWTVTWAGVYHTRSGK
jgi:hypothetical protein